jgi:hypothetical protein
MSSKNLSYTLDLDGPMPSIKSILPKAIIQNATDFLNPPIKNIGYKGIEKTSREIVNWFNTSKHIERDFTTTAMLMEKAGTGGAIFRNLYRDFLLEAQEHISSKPLIKAHENYCSIAKSWHLVSELFNEAGKTENQKHINEASALLRDLSIQEKQTMELLLTVDCSHTT